jgi:hypothetical protein
VCERVLHRHSTIPLTYIAFDVLSGIQTDYHVLRVLQHLPGHTQPRLWEDTPDGSH